MGDLLGFGFPHALLHEEFQLCVVFLMGLLYADPVLRHPGSLYAAVSGAHQSDCNPTLDIPACLRFRLPPLLGQETG